VSGREVTFSVEVPAIAALQLARGVLVWEPDLLRRAVEALAAGTVRMLSNVDDELIGYLVMFPAGGGPDAGR
jgi:hypothetical protein